MPARGASAGVFPMHRYHSSRALLPLTAVLLLTYPARVNAHEQGTSHLALAGRPLLLLCALLLLSLCSCGRQSQKECVEEPDWVVQFITGTTFATLCATGFTWLFKESMKRALDKRVESHKIELQTQGQQQTERLKAELHAQRQLLFPLGDNYTSPSG
jgi:hypothetical protein